ncbi:hypothetical protein ACFC9N_10765 [Enterococcus casseliflavus]|uniref:hypothetical protein n=1 Tax=Enterococcus casseliflavus TaxID=37734 RepID=UPI0039A6D200
MYYIDYHNLTIVEIKTEEQESYEIERTNIAGREISIRVNHLYIYDDQHSAWQALISSFVNAELDQVFDNLVAVPVERESYLSAKGMLEQLGKELDSIYRNAPIDTSGCVYGLCVKRVQYFLLFLRTYHLTITIPEDYLLFIEL